MNIITGTIGATAGNIINNSNFASNLSKFQVRYNGTGDWLECSDINNITNKSNCSFEIKLKDGETLTTMYCMFNNCSALTSLDLSNFDTSSVTNMQNIFNGCSSLTSLDVSNWNLDLNILTSYSNILTGSNALQTINLSHANEDTITVIFNSVPSQTIIAKVTSENIDYANTIKPDNVIIENITFTINTTKQQLLYNILYGIQNPNIVPHDTEELILYGIMMNQDVNVRLNTIVQSLYYTWLKKGL